MKVLVLDNYDSFTYNLVHYCEEFCDSVEVRRNDQIALEEFEGFDKVLLSPGPGLPKDAGCMMEFLKRYADEKSILGVCLGLQAIGEHFGARLENLEYVLHGKSSQLKSQCKSPLFESLPHQFQIGHYHSWVIHPESIPADLEVIASNEDGLVMAIQHRDLPIFGVQFHPESVLTPQGRKIIQNWLAL